MLRHRVYSRVVQMVTWPVLLMFFLSLRVFDLASNSCEIADFGRLRFVSRDWRIVFDVVSLEVELRYIEHKYAGYFASFQSQYEAAPLCARRLSCPI